MRCRQPGGGPGAASGCDAKGPAACACPTAAARSDDGSGKNYPQGTCTLKQQEPIPAGGQPAVYAQGSLVQWASGYLPA